MTRVIHTGDTHIGYQQYNSPARRDDFLAAFRQVAEDAVADDVDAVVHAGDLFHDRRPGLVDLQGTVEILRTLEEADIPFLAVVGNHEGKRDAQWLDLFADLGLATRLGPQPEVVGDVALYGLDFVPRSRREDLEYEFGPVPDAADHATLVSHGLFEPFAHADWDTARLLSESTVEFDVVLLGDNHKPDTAEVQDTWVTYCGSTERASASEREDRGYNLVTFETDSDADDAVAISRRALTATRDFEFVDVDLEEGEGIDRVQERVREYDVEDSVVIVTIEGDGKPVTPAAVEELAIDRGALVARVNDRRDLPDEDDEVSVSFANPDEAVRERVRELGLSNAALEIDKTVRDDDLVDSNVRESVERRVRELLEDDQSAFDPAPARTPDDEDVTTVADQLSGTESNATEPEPAETAAEAEPESAPAAEPTPDQDDVTTDERDSSAAEAASENVERADAEQSQPTDEDASLGDFA
ncbi:exonuclease SbcCD subunit D [Natronolimnobius sp. AArcel1]|uniref:DNA double-strand break repair protein Mre11 n=1 Tax=Natronolimnobius sp. AArcel1 TaxID=1679093 RepID=UPI0013EA0DD7|nr:DNA double-strand break repair protein Mre11 [Natronolimnobius sp. AArcel1]NGM71487.1 exonuclease SbcCD subunit D [Natronolimnobius sp. AArcel1]